MGLLTSNKYHDRLRVAHEDWGHKWVERGLLWYYSDRPDNITNLIYTEPCDDSYHGDKMFCFVVKLKLGWCLGPRGLCCKTRYLFEHLQVFDLLHKIGRNLKAHFFFRKLGQMQIGFYEQWMIHIFLWKLVETFHFQMALFSDCDILIYSRMLQGWWKS